jgi:hypothetical protein
MFIALVISLWDLPPCGTLCADRCDDREKRERAECIERFPGDENWPARSACFDAASERRRACQRTCRAKCK